MKFIKYYTSYYMLYEYLCFPGVNCPFLFEHSICLFLSFYPNISSLRSRVARWRCRVLVLLAKAFSWSNGNDAAGISNADYIRLPCHSQSKKSKKDEAEATACEIMGHQIHTCLDTVRYNSGICGCGHATKSQAGLVGEILKDFLCCPADCNRWTVNWRNHHAASAGCASNFSTQIPRHTMQGRGIALKLKSSHNFVYLAQSFANMLFDLGFCCKLLKSIHTVFAWSCSIPRTFFEAHSFRGGLSILRIQPNEKIFDYHLCCLLAALAVWPGLSLHWVAGSGWIFAMRNTMRSNDCLMFWSPRPPDLDSILPKKQEGTCLVVNDIIWTLWHDAWEVRGRVKRKEGRAFCMWLWGKGRQAVAAVAGALGFGLKWHCCWQLTYFYNTFAWAILGLRWFGKSPGWLPR